MSRALNSRYPRLSSSVYESTRTSCRLLGEVPWLARFGFNRALNYEIVVNWVVAEQKSQGLFQTEHHDEERYWLFAASGKGSPERTQNLFARLRPSR
jgi:hypothetical protein